MSRSLLRKASTLGRASGSLSGMPNKAPIFATRLYCARTANGLVVAAIPRTPINSRRLMPAPGSRQRIVVGHIGTLEGPAGVRTQILLRLSMSALGHKRTNAAQEAMSALPPKADIRASVH